MLVSAEHGGNRVPEAYEQWFWGQEDLLASHRGWDPGTAGLARQLAASLDGQVLIADVTRLLVDLNRSAHHPRVFSELTRSLPRAERAVLLDLWHEPHRARVADAVERLSVGDRRVLHLGVHSFTPVLGGKERQAELALLYDPSRPLELELAERWCGALRARCPGIRVRRNYPYRGRSDGLTTTLRSRFPSKLYLGIEIEVNQSLLAGDGRFPAWIGEALASTCPVA